jgi:hypothetical protein
MGSLTPPRDDALTSVVAGQHHATLGREPSLVMAGIAVVSSVVDAR